MLQFPSSTSLLLSVEAVTANSLLSVLSDLKKTCLWKFSYTYAYLYIYYI